MSVCSVMSVCTPLLWDVGGMKVCTPRTVNVVYSNILECTSVHSKNLGVHSCALQIKEKKETFGVHTMCTPMLLECTTVYSKDFYHFGVDICPLQNGVHKVNIWNIWSAFSLTLSLNHELRFRDQEIEGGWEGEKMKWPRWSVKIGMPCILKNWRWSDEKTCRGWFWWLQ
jgi:hypothetical protein